MRVGDVVIVSLRDFQDSKADVIHKYTDNEVRNLRIYGEIPSHVISGNLDTATTEVSGLQKEDERTACVFDFDAI